MNKTRLIAQMLRNIFIVALHTRDYSMDTLEGALNLFEDILCEDEQAIRSIYTRCNIFEEQINDLASYIRKHEDATNMLWWTEFNEAIPSLVEWFMVE